MNNAWNVAQDCKQDVNEEVGIAAALKKYTERWQEDRKDDLANVAV